MKVGPAGGRVADTMAKWTGFTTPDDPDAVSSLELPSLPFCKGCCCSKGQVFWELTILS